MGVPKYFRWLSERYPLIMQLVEENRIPEFDNLYLDMNGIIHNCSHPNDGEATFRIAEEEIFLGIFAYIEHLFSKIRPRKVFFLAIDGVAPRAKMNQQRSRRFRTAQEAKEGLQKAISRGEDIPASPPFDSNCITPGTVFMRKLSIQLEYFIAKKVNEDSDWRDVQVILSGHETPGEGEHKIMEFIRTIKAQPGYNPNTRHCLYGLDADLIMLGLLSHDPHFALLREEVVFGPRRAKKSIGLESQTFYLLHLSLLREYLELEFSHLRKTLPFSFDLEKIIDDYILLHLFVGNDFLPHLPGLHINEGAIELLFRVYERVLPRAGGYINQQGRLQPRRLELLIKELASVDHSNFVGAHLPKVKAAMDKSRRAQESMQLEKRIELTPRQAEAVRRVVDLITSFLDNPGGASHHIKFSAIPAADETDILQIMATKLQLEFETMAYDPEDDTLHSLFGFPSGRAQALRLNQSHNGATREQTKKWMLSKIAAFIEALASHDPQEDALDMEGSSDGPTRQVERMYRDEKAVYYHSKMSIDSKDPEQLHDIVYNYIEGMQWVLHYYYDGIASWGWYYHYHYAPHISDLTHIGDFTFSFDQGRPFLPFEQLMGVLPPLSKQLIPAAFQPLMTDPTSPILDFYPATYESDLNGKKNSWEAVVKIPFIDQDRLTQALERRQGGLTNEERERNSHGHPHRFWYDASYRHTMPSSLPGFLPDLLDTHTRIETYTLPSMSGRRFIKTLPKGVSLGLNAMPGFPSLKTLPFTHKLEKTGVEVHSQPSRDLSMILHMNNPGMTQDVAAYAKDLIGQTTFIHWPYLFEGLVVGVSDSHHEYRAHWKDMDVVTQCTESPYGSQLFDRQQRALKEQYLKRHGMALDRIDVLLHVRPFKGLSHGYDGSIIKQYEPSAQSEVVHPLQLLVSQVRHPDARFMERPPMTVSEEYPEGTKVFFLGVPGFGCPARVIGTAGDQITVEMAFFHDMAKEHAILRKIVQQRAQVKYFTTQEVTAQLRVSSLVLAKLASGVAVYHGNQRMNIGLNLKFEAKGRKVLGYSRRTSQGWEYSERAVRLMQDVLTKFPELRRGLSKRLASGEFYSSEDIFEQNTAQRIKDLRTWIHENGLRDMDIVPLYVDRLERSVISLLESATSIMAQKRAQHGLAVKRQILRGLPRGALLKPEQARYRVPEQTFDMGDRVINVFDFGPLPLAAKGTVIGLGANKCIDVVFDAPFLAGTTLGDACSNHRGATVSTSSVLNLSTPQIATRWGEESVKEAHLSPLQRTLKVREQPASQDIKGTLFYQPAAPKAQKERPRSAATPQQGPVDATAQHLKALSLQPLAHQRPPPNAWKPRGAPSSGPPKKQAGPDKTGPLKQSGPPKTGAPKKQPGPSKTGPSKQSGPKKTGPARQGSKKAGPPKHGPKQPSPPKN